MMTEQIYAVHVLFFRDRLKLPRRDVVAAAAECFRQHLLFAELTRRRADLSCGQLRRTVARKIVYSRDMLVFVRRRTTRAPPHLRIQLCFLHAVSRQLAAVGIAPVV